MTGYKALFKLLSDKKMNYNLLLNWKKRVMCIETKNKTLTPTFSKIICNVSVVLLHFSYQIVDCFVYKVSLFGTFILPKL